MNDLPQLISDLDILNRDYLALSKLRSGKLFVDFYNYVFIPEYSKSTEISRDVLDKVEKSLIGGPNNLEKFIRDLKKTYLIS